jgi:hypothetical protein
MELFPMSSCCQRSLALNPRFAVRTMIVRDFSSVSKVDGHMMGVEKSAGSTMLKTVSRFERCFGVDSFALSGLGCPCASYPGLAPWAGFFRRFADDGSLSQTGVGRRSRRKTLGIACDDSGLGLGAIGFRGRCGGFASGGHAGSRGSKRIHLRWCGSACAARRFCRRERHRLGRLCRGLRDR